MLMEPHTELEERMQDSTQPHSVGHTWADSAFQGNSPGRFLLLWGPFLSEPLGLNTWRGSSWQATTHRAQHRPPEHPPVSL